MLPSDGTKHWLKSDQGSVTNCVTLGTHMAIPGVPSFLKYQMASKILFWIFKSLVLSKLACFFLPPHHGSQLL